MLFVRFLCAVRWNRIFPAIAAINLTIDIVLNLVLMRIWGVAGIALSTSIVYIGCCLMLAIVSLRFFAKERAATFTAMQAQQAGR
jgi:peptidoglycan biosynthesis protein MviN/MurJ (putative lipid II flippase)